MDPACEVVAQQLLCKSRVRSCHVVTTALVALLVPLGARAERLRLEDALVRAEARNPDVRAARARAAQGSGRRSIAGYLVPSKPSVELAWRSDRVFADTGERSVDVGLEQELEIFGQRGLRIDLAEAELAALRSEISAVRLALKARVTVAYFELMYQERRAGASRLIAEQAARLEEAARRRLAARDISEGEYTLIAADRTSALADAAEAESDRLEAGARLNVLIGRAGSADTTTAGDFPLLRPAEAPGNLAAQARARRSDLAAAAREVTAREREVRLRNRERLPNPVLSVGYARDRSVLGPEDFSGVSAQAVDSDQFLALGIRFSLPLLRTGSGEVAEARGRRAEAEARRDGLAASIDEEVTSLWARHERARQQIDGYAAIEPKLANTIALYEKAYAAGQIDLAGFLAVRDRVLKVTLAALKARRDGAAAAAELERAAGGDYTGATR